MIPLKPGINVPSGWWNLNVQPDITAEESVHLGIVLSTYAIINRGMDLWSYVKEHNLVRHFKQDKQEDATIAKTKAV